MDKKQIRVKDVIENVMGFVCYGINKEGLHYVQCRTDLLKIADYQFMEELGAKPIKFNDYRTRFYFDEGVEVID